MQVFGEQFRFQPAKLAMQSLRFATIFAVAVWFGGFTFYSTAVIDTSQKVLHSHLRAGLITQQVTNWLNWISLPALAICAGNWFAHRKDQRTFWKWGLGLALGGMVLTQIALFPAHMALDARIIDHDIANEGEFFKFHRLYLVLATLQWCATLAYIWAALVLWTEKTVEPSNLKLCSSGSGGPLTRKESAGPVQG